MGYSPRQLAHWLHVLQACGLEATIINGGTDGPIAPQDIKSSGMVYIQIGEKRFPAWVWVSEQ